MEKSRAIELLEHLAWDRDIDRNPYGDALNMAIEALKAQLSSEDATKDAISKTETVEHLRRMLEATVPNTDYDEGFVDGIEFAISTVSTMPPIQSQSTTGQLNDGARSTAQSTDLIDRQAAIDALQKCRKHCIDPFDSYHIDIQDAENQLSKLPPAQPEPKEGEWILYDKRFPWRTWYKCSNCGNYLDFSGVNGGRGEVNYCPNCGAKMKGERQK